jgi:predicted AAA+ superfamily ATPase
MSGMKEKYLGRIVDKELDLYLKSFGAVLIEGAKWCGKTRTAKEKAASAIYFHDPSMREQYQEMVKISPGILLSGETPRLIDEWQKIPEIWDGVRFEVDQREEKGQFILTGSSKPKKKSTMHTGTGRIAKLLMRPMALFESGDSNGSVSLESLFKGEKISGESNLSIEKLAYLLVRGGWPASVTSEEDSALLIADQYVKRIIDSDISEADGVERDPVRMEQLMRSLARNTSTMARMKTIQTDMTDISASDKTISSDIKALKKIYVVEELPAWAPEIRSRVHLRTTPKHHFVDPSLAAAVLQVSPQDLIWDLKTFGLLFESLCIRDLRVYSQAMNGMVRHYHDGNDLEVDAIVNKYGGQWGAIEIKMGTSNIDAAAQNLNKLKDKIDTEKMRGPSFLMVLTSTGFAYRREDGVYVVPIGCLKN